MWQDPLVDKVRLHVRKVFDRRMPKHLVFHDLEHTLTVARTALEIGRAMELPARDMADVEIAALFHDLGYSRKHKGHEAESAKLARTYLRRAGVGERRIVRIEGLIRATELGTLPRSTLQRVLRDADSSKAGQADFEERSELLRREFERVQDRAIPENDWADQNLAYLRAHRFFTPYAQRRFGRQKDLNLRRADQRVKERRGSITIGPERYLNRDLSWLSFNDRVLQEARDPRVPLLERIKFLAIYSSNLDEFYRVRVASLRSLAKLGKKEKTFLGVTPEKLIARINRKALLQQQEFGRLYREELLPALAKQGIHFRNEKTLDAKQKAFVREHFRKSVAPLLQTAAVRAGNAPFIEDRKLYLVCRLQQKGAARKRLVLVNVPADELGRFLLLPAKKDRTELIWLDDVLRLGLPLYFKGHKLDRCHAVKLSRDADLYLEEEFADNVADKVRRSLRKRRTGTPSRFLYDQDMPKGMLRALRDLLGLKAPDLVAGGRYHNFNDLFGLPVKGHKELREPPPHLVPCPALDTLDRFAALRAHDHLLHFPYHDFGHVVRWLEQAANDPHVHRIAITLYRVARTSRIGQALLDARANGKQVDAFVEVQARFDERTNLAWGEALEKAGARVIYGYEGLKVHAKLCLVERTERGRTQRYAYLGTGNFNERTAALYADSALLTAAPAITQEVARVFDHLRDRRHVPTLDHLLMAPLSLRSRIEALIDKEIEHAMRGRPAAITFKLNSLEDRAMIRKLYDADRAGVDIRLIVRGICCLVTEVKGMSDRIRAISIVDKYLEHARVYIFHNAGKPLVYMASADLMERNLDRRVEVAFPVLDRDLRQEVIDLVELQWRDNVKARRIDKEQRNPYVDRPKDAPEVRAQEAIPKWLRTRARKPRSRS
ncbi:MAG: polyphosphate kinase 1 [Flavobacteriales bacterium]|nr:polyphosphate kinase 1 [Flavobacteriales bacterium]MCB9167187.1 polyphosphate kinase 1 [Flavobacteriales bacterium]